MQSKSMVFSLMLGALVLGAAEHRKLRDRAFLDWREAVGVAA